MKRIEMLSTCIVAIWFFGFGAASAQAPSAAPTTYHYAKCPDAQPYIDEYLDAYKAVVFPASGDAGIESARKWKLTNDRLISAMERCAVRLSDQWKRQTGPTYEYQSIYDSAYLYAELARLDVFAMEVDWDLKGPTSLYVKSYREGDTYEKLIFFEAAHACRSIALATAGMVSPDKTPVTDNPSVATFLSGLSTTRIKLDDLVRQYIPDNLDIVGCEKTK